MLQEIWGVTANLRRICDGFAAEGYEAVAPQLFDRLEPDFQSPRGPDRVAKALDLEHRTSWDDVVGDIQASIETLVPPVFAIGFCYGGTAAWIAACRCTGLAAVASFYANGVAGFSSETPRCPVVLHFGAQDQIVPAQHWDVIRQAQPEIPLYVYDAGHGFFDPDRPEYAHEAAELSRQRTLALFEARGGRPRAAQSGRPAAGDAA